MRTIFILFSFFLGLNGLYAQNDSWAISMSPSRSLQAYEKSSEFPTDFVKKHWNQGKFMSNIAFDGEAWWVVMTQKNYKQQTFYRSTDFPNDWIDRKWSEGFDITDIEFADEQWIVVMSRGAGFEQEGWAKKNSFDEIKTYIEQQWKAGKYIIDLAYGQGQWVGVLSKGAQFRQQTFRWSASYPAEWIQENYGKGFNITGITYGDGQWLVVMSKLKKAQNEVSMAQTTFPANYIKTNWDKNYRISQLHFNYEPQNRKDYFQDHYAAGNKALNAKNYDLAIRHYTEALKLQPNNANCYNNRAWAKYLLGQCETALNDVNSAIQLEADEHSYHSRAAIYLCLGRCNKALDDFNTAERMAQTKDAFYYGDRAMAQECLGNFEAAAKDYQKALSINPQEAIYKKGLAQAKAQMKETSPPSVSWDYPYKAYTASTDPVYEVKACINSELEITSVKLLLNGKSFSARGFGLEDDCDRSLSETVRLQEGRNELVIQVQTNKHEMRSEKRIIEYKASSNGNYHALIIAVENYDDFAISDLEKPIDDATELQKVLTQTYTFEPSDVHFLKNPTKEEILNKLVYLQDRLTDDDNLLVYYSGHGIVKNEVGYWLPKDSKKNSRSNWLSNAELRDYMNAMKAKHTLVVADACFSGSIFTGGFRNMEEFACEEMAKLKSRRAITSGANTVVPDNSIFFKYFIKMLGQNDASCFTAENLYSKIKPAVIYNSPNNHVPQFGVLPQTGDEGGNFVFRKR